MIINFSNRFTISRLWEIRVYQIPFSQRAPAGCLQYFTGTEGIIKVFPLMGYSIDYWLMNVNFCLFFLDI